MVYLYNFVVSLRALLVKVSLTAFCLFIFGCGIFYIDPKTQSSAKVSSQDLETIVSLQTNTNGNSEVCVSLGEFNDPANPIKSMPGSRKTVLSGGDDLLATVGDTKFFLNPIGSERCGPNQNYLASLGSLPPGTEVLLALLRPRLDKKYETKLAVIKTFNIELQKRKDTYLFSDTLIFNVGNLESNENLVLTSTNTCEKELSSDSEIHEAVTLVQSTRNDTWEVGVLSLLPQKSLNYDFCKSVISASKRKNFLPLPGTAGASQSHSQQTKSDFLTMRSLRKSN